jgi:hypothetical protein
MMMMVMMMIMMMRMRMKDLAPGRANEAPHAGSK